MSYEYGRAAFNLEMTDRVPRTEYSVLSHWELVKNVCGIDVNSGSSEEEKMHAVRTMAKAWDFSFMWSVMEIDALDVLKTDMGHAVFEADGIDFSDKIS